MVRLIILLFVLSCQPASISPHISKGINIPVDSLAPWTKAKPVTIKTAKPLIPDLAIPNKSEQLNAVKKARLRYETAV